MSFSSFPSLHLPPPYHSLPRLLRHPRLPLRGFLASHALAVVSGHLFLPDPHPHTLLLCSYSHLRLPSFLPLLLLFRSSLRLFVPPTPYSLPLAISTATASHHRGHLPFALSLHALAITHNLLLFPHVSNALISLYSKKGLQASM